MKINQRTLPRIILNYEFNKGEEECKIAYHLLKKANVPFLPLGPSVDFPSFDGVILDYGPVRYHGIEGIKRFIKAWKKKKLPILLEL